MTGIIFATRIEANAFLKDSGATLVRKPLYNVQKWVMPYCAIGSVIFTALPFLYKFFTPVYKCVIGDKEFVIILSGVGLVMGRLGAKLLIGKYGVKRIINPGIAGSLNSSLKMHDACTISVASNQNTTHICEPFDELKPARLVSVARPVFDSARREELFSHGDLVDMEGAAIAAVCEKLAIPCQMLKVVSDNADAKGASSIKENIATLSKKLSDILVKNIK